jgi:hypothetical protein
LLLTRCAHAAKYTFELPLPSYADGIFLLRDRDLRIEDLAVRARGWKIETALRAWVSSLRRLSGSDEGHPPPRIETTRARWGSFVWSRTAHASSWQRFARLAWLTDSWTQGMRHVAARSLFQAMSLRQKKIR